MTRRLQLRRFRLVMIVLASALTSASGAKAADGDGATMYDSLSANPTGLFPPTSSDGEAAPAVNLAFESLLTRHWDTYEWMPELANKWEISPDGRQFTFTLDPLAKFWDGSPVTAEDVKYSFDMIFFDGMRTADLRPYYENIEKVEILSPSQVRFHTKNLYYKNFDVCADLTVFQKKHYAKLIAQDKTMTKAEVTKDVMGTSPWRLEKWDENQQLVFRRNPDYWNKASRIAQGRWNIERRVFRIIPEASVAYETFRRGDLTLHVFQAKEWALNSDGPEFKTKLVKVKTVNKAPRNYSFIGWNNIDPLVGDKNVRWGLSHLVNLALWVKKFDFDLSEPTVSPFSPKSDEHDPALKPVEFSLEQARQSFAKAGWTKAGPDGFLVKDGKRFEVEIIYPVQAKDAQEPKLTELKNTAAKVGVLIQLKAVEWTSFTKLLEEHRFQAATLSWTRAIDPDQKQIWHSASIAGQGSNFVSYSNPAVDKLIDAQRTTMDRTQRVALDRQIEHLIYDDQPYTFLTEGKYTLYAHQSYVKKDRDTFKYEIGTEFWKFQPQAQ